MVSGKLEMRILSFLSKMLFAITLFVSSVTLSPTIFLANASVPSEPHAANAMWIEPTYIMLSPDTYNIGYKFNVTVWVNITHVQSSAQVVKAWQLVVSYNSSQLNATRCGYTAGTKSQFFSNITAVPVTPQFGSLNATHNFVMHGETWISGPKRKIPGYGSLSWIEFEIIAKPPQGQAYTSLVGLIITGVRISKILDDELNKTPFTPYPSVYRYGPNTCIVVPIKGGQNATIEGNVIITNAIVAKNILHFEASGPSGLVGWIKVTFPKINKTEIKVFINKVKLTPPPFPEITIANETHYFIYFEFTLSTKSIDIEFERADIAITNITLAKTIVGKGYINRINATIQNKGDYEETFNVTAYANTTEIERHIIILASETSTTVTFTWNTTGFAKGNYTISAYAEPVLGETDLDDNNCTDGWILITKVGDFGGGLPPEFFKCDGRVDGIDLALFIQCYKGLAGNAQYLGDLGGLLNNVPTFFACDGKVDGIDLALWIQCYKGLGP